MEVVLLEVIQAPEDLGPFPAEPFVFHADFQLTLENQGQEAAKDVTTDGFIAFVMLSARANGTDPLAAVERTIGWQRLEEMVEAMDENLGGTRADNLAEVIEGYPRRVHRTATIILGAFTFRWWKSTDSLLTALEVLRQLAHSPPGCENRR